MTDERSPDTLVTLRRNTLEFRFPGVHPRARVSVSFIRTLRVPDDGRKYPLPAGFGAFPLRHVEDFADRLPATIVERGGVILPMYQAEALWMSFRTAWPSAIQVGTGKICAVTGEAWRGKLAKKPEQNYLIAPQQPWLDGYAMEKGEVRQFVAMPLGRGYTVEEQKTGTAKWNGIQLQCFPLRRAQWEEEQRAREERVDFSQMMMLEDAADAYSVREPSAVPLGIAPGGTIEQEIYEDDRPLEHWDRAHPARVYVHLLNSHDWMRVTGEAPPETPITIEAYRRAGIPWFDHYRDDLESRPGGEGFEGVKSIGAMGAVEDPPAPGGEGAAPISGPVIDTGPSSRPRRVRSAEF